MKNLFTTKNLALMAMFAAIIGVAAYSSIPLPFPGTPHLTMQNFCILLVAMLFPAPMSFVIVLVWMLLGIVGLPVFIGGKSSIGYILNQWGGYTLAFLPTAVVLPLIRGKKYNRVRYTIVSVFGALMIDFLGMLYLHYYPASGYANWAAAFSAGFLSFLPLDLVKAVVVAQIIPAFRRIMPENM